MTKGNSVGLYNWGGFSAQFRVKTSGRETELSRMVLSGDNTRFEHNDLINAGFKIGDSCWVSADVQAGETNHQSGGNFMFSEGGNLGGVTYEIRGGAWTPSWSGPDGGDTE
jgi:hypothetical protein